MWPNSRAVDSWLGFGKLLKILPFLFLVSCCMVEVQERTGSAVFWHIFIFVYIYIYTFKHNATYFSNVGLYGRGVKENMQCNVSGAL